MTIKKQLFQHGTEEMLADRADKLLDKAREELRLLQRVNRIVELDQAEVDLLAAMHLDGVITSLAREQNGKMKEFMDNPGIDPEMFGLMHLLEKLGELQCQLLSSMAARKKSTGKLKA